MPAPVPLTATPKPDIDWSRPRTPASKTFDDIYFSVDNGLEEARAVYLGGCGLPQAWAGCDLFTIGELGFGTGLNFLATWQAWREAKASGSVPQQARLHYVGIEKYPLSAEALQTALGTWPERTDLSEDLIRELVADWPDQVKGVHRRHFGAVTLTLIHEDVLRALQDYSASVDAWYLDGFSPDKNPDMWTTDIFRVVYQLSAPNARLATFTVAGHVRAALQEAGFEVEKKPGFGRKRHRLEAHKPAEAPHIHTSRDTYCPIIIGAGIAGASVAKACLRRGISPIIIDPEDGTAGSGNPAAIIKPRIDLQDRPESRFYLSAYLYARSVYAQVGAVLHEGIIHEAKDAKETERYKRFHAQAALPDTHIVPRPDGVVFNRAITVDPSIIRSAWTEGATRVRGRAVHAQKDTTGWEVFDSDGKSLARGSHICVCAGFGVRDLGYGDILGLRYSRGQLTWAHPIRGFDTPYTYGGYGIPLLEGVLVGTTHARISDKDPYLLSDADDVSNLERLSDKLGQTLEAAQKPSRASVRVNTADTVPLMDELGPNFHILTGLGSRGFVFAPLLGEAMVSAICAEPDALSLSARTRFQAREKPNLKTRPHMYDLDR